MTTREMWETYSSLRLSTERCRQAARTVFTSEYGMDLVSAALRGSELFMSASIAWNDPGPAFRHRMSWVMLDSTKRVFDEIVAREIPLLMVHYVMPQWTPVFCWSYHPRYMSKVFEEKASRWIWNVLQGSIRRLSPRYTDYLEIGPPPWEVSYEK